MSTSRPAETQERPAGGGSGSFTTLAALVLGAPLAVGVLALVEMGPLKDMPIARYVSHAVEKVEVLLFCCALMGLAAKLWGYRSERGAFRWEPLRPRNNRFKLCTGPKGRHGGWLHLYRLAGAGGTGFPGLAFPHLEDAEITKLNPALVQ